MQWLLYWASRWVDTMGWGLITAGGRLLGIGGWCQLQIWLQFKLTENFCFYSRLLRIGGLGRCARFVVVLYLALGVFLPESSYDERPPSSWGKGFNVWRCLVSHFLHLFLWRKSMQIWQNQHYPSSVRRGTLSPTALLLIDSKAN